MRTRVIFRIAAAAFLLIALASAGLAQTTGGIVGRVTDENGGGLPGVTVQVESPVLQGARVTTTDPDGHFRLNLLPPGDYTLTFGFIIEEAVVRAEHITGGNAGRQLEKLVIGGIDFDDGTNFYYLVTVIAVLCVLGVLNLLRSPTGRAFVAIRDSEVSAQSMGINIAHYKTVAFALSAALAGIAGALYAHKIRIITPDQFGFLQSIELLMMVVIGGLGAIQGAIFGPAFWFIVQQVIVIGKDWLPPALGQQTGLQPTIFGIILIAVVLFEPMGLYGRWLKFRTFLQIFPFYRKGMFKRQKSYMKSERMK